jgi:Helix-turn-helix domain
MLAVQVEWRDACVRLASRTFKPAAAPPASNAALNQVAAFFVELRRYLGLSIHQAAAIVETHPDVIQALEAGSLAELPAWPETHRIVTLYAGLAAIDPAPVLHNLRLVCMPGPTVVAAAQGPAPAQYAAAAQQVPRAAAGPMPAPPEAGEPARGLWSRWPLKRMALAVAIMSLLGATAQGSVRQAAMGALPQPAARVLYAVEDAVLVSLARRVDGLAWIEVSDPRTRRRDKLPTRTR